MGGTGKDGEVEGAREQRAWREVKEGGQEGKWRGSLIPHAYQIPPPLNVGM